MRTGRAALQRRVHDTPRCKSRVSIRRHFRGHGHLNSGTALAVPQAPSGARPAPHVFSVFAEIVERGTDLLRGGQSVISIKKYLDWDAAGSRRSESKRG